MWFTDYTRMGIMNSHMHTQKSESTTCKILPISDESLQAHLCMHQYKVQMAVHECMDDTAYKLHNVLIQAIC